MIAVSDAAATTCGVLAFDTADGDPHPVIGAEIARDALSAEQCGWIRHHHERADGDGHPDGLTAERTPEGASILAVAEAWDGLTGAGEGLSPQEALETLRAEAGHRFANEVIEALVRLQRDSMSTV
jgi:HD-GYP domain-containing protein (c-di-GMP phosphodiesterase class II)